MESHCRSGAATALFIAEARERAGPDEISHLKPGSRNLCRAIATGYLLVNIYTWIYLSQTYIVDVVRIVNYLRGKERERERERESEREREFTFWQISS